MAESQVQSGRRAALKALAAAGIGTTVFSRALVTLAEEQASLTPEMIARAEWISGLTLDDEKRKLMLEDLGQTLESYDRLRAIEIDNGVPPALRFELAGRRRSGAPSRRARPQPADSRRPQSDDDLAFAGVAQLAAWQHHKQISSVELTQLYLDRLKRHDETLHCVITLTEELALEQAKRADEERTRGQVRGPLHGVPWGAKDLLAVPGYPTTWGANPFREQTLDVTATVAARLEQAGAVLLAKLAVGALAWGDVWYDEMCRNPWNPEQGSSGSSAGSASATAAGLVGFSIGTETWGSIVSPCTRCGATGLRPTFGRVSGYGTMALAWSMDKIGPIARSAEDCALVFDAIHGADEKDPVAIDAPFGWPPRPAAAGLRVGYVEALFEEGPPEWADEAFRKRFDAWRAHDRETLKTLRGLGYELTPVSLPDEHPVADLAFILSAEAATAFDELTRSGKDGRLVRQVRDAWPNVFRQGQLIPAVEYIRANRVRTMVMESMERAMAEVDVYVCPSFGGDNLLLTNLTGHPSVVLPNGFVDGTPTSITFVGSLDGDEALLAVADRYQRATSFHRERPAL